MPIKWVSQESKIHTFLAGHGLATTSIQKLFRADEVDRRFAPLERLRE
jgi:hypothetical protein